MTSTLIAEHREDILTSARLHGARNVRVFGSHARGDAHAASDLDILVDLDPGRGLFDILHLKWDLEEILGCPVDVLTEAGLYWLLKRRILKEAQKL